MTVLLRVIPMVALMIHFAAALQAAEIAAFPLNGEQARALDDYAKENGEKAFAAGPDGQYASQTSYSSATIAASEALRACDKNTAEATKRCILVDFNGTPVPLALQLAQASRADTAVLKDRIGLRDLTLSTEIKTAIQGLAEKKEHKAFAMSIKGSWARSWEAKSIEDAEKYALDTCNKSKRAAGAPCFILVRDGEQVDASTLVVNGDLSVTKQP